MKCWISERKVKWNEVSMDEKLTSEWVYFGGGKDSWQLDYEEAVAYRFCLSRWVHFLSNSRLSLKTKSWLCFTPVTRRTRRRTRRTRRRTRRTRTRTPHQNLSEGSVLQTWNLVPRLNWQNKDQVKYNRWSVTIPRMVTPNSRDGHPLSKSTRRKNTTDLKFGT